MMSRNSIRNSALSESPTVVGTDGALRTLPERQSVDGGRDAEHNIDAKEEEERKEEEEGKEEEGRKEKAEGRESGGVNGKDGQDFVDPFLVVFNEGDPANPKNWSNLKRWYITFTASLLVLNATFASSAPSNIIPQLEEAYGFSQEVGTLLVSLFVAGYCVGPLLWGPLSEAYGRRPVAVITFGAYTCFQLGCALAKNTASILIFRFLAGTFAAAPLTNSGAIIADIWDSNMRGNAMAVFTLSPFAGPALGPLVAGYIVVGGASWRWVFWVMTIFAGISFIQIVFTIPETYAPTLLIQKAKRIRKETGDSRYYAPLEKSESSFRSRAETALAKPFRILFSEPMLLAITVYMSFVYGCIYLLFEAYPIVFTEGHHLNPGASGLMFLPIPIGGAIAVLAYVSYFNPRYATAALKHHPHPVPPEHRLEIAMLAAPLFAISFFWFGWTSYPSISYWSPLMAGVLMAFSICWIFISLINYIVDAYLFVAASALAASTVVRSMAGAGFPLFATQMYTKLDPRWASTVIGFIALIMIPIPFVLTRFGPTLRLKSRYAPMKHVVPVVADPSPA